jgi:hypothetical protein
VCGELSDLFLNFQTQKNSTKMYNSQVTHALVGWPNFEKFLITKPGGAM